MGTQDGASAAQGVLKVPRGTVEKLGVAMLISRLISVTYGTCAACDSQAHLRIIESRRRRGLRDLLARHFDRSVLRYATCLSCGAEYPIRNSDGIRKGAGARAHVRLRMGRDWNYTAA